MPTTDDLKLPALSRETRAAFYRGYETAIESCILIVKNSERRTGRDLIAQMRDLIIEQGRK